MDIGKYKVTLDKVIAAALENFEAELKNSNIESLTTENKNELIRQSLYEYALKRNKEFD